MLAIKPSNFKEMHALYAGKELSWSTSSISTLSESNLKESQHPLRPSFTIPTRFLTEDQLLFCQSLSVAIISSKMLQTVWFYNFALSEMRKKNQLVSRCCLQGRCWGTRSRQQNSRALQHPQQLNSLIICSSETHLSSDWVL